MLFGDLSHNGQTKARPFHTPLSRLDAPLKKVEDSPEILLADACSIVPHGKNVKVRI